MTAEHRETSLGDRKQGEPVLGVYMEAFDGASNGTSEFLCLWEPIGKISEMTGLDGGLGRTQLR